MNLILFEPTELERPLPRSDRRARHIVEILRRTVGDSVDAAIVNGPRGKATVVGVDDAALMLAFAPIHPPSPPVPIALLVGLPRPQTARDILRDATTLGVGAIHFVRTEKSDASYAQSTLWSSGEWRRQVLAGAEQAFDSRVPDITCGQSLAEVLAVDHSAQRIGIDNYEATSPLSELAHLSAAVTMAIGPERGWAAADRASLRAHGFQLMHLGTRVLRTETACVAALSLLRAKLGLM